MDGFRLALCSFSSGPANGIARMDDALADSLTFRGVSVARYLVDSGAGREVERHGDVLRVPLRLAWEVLPGEFAGADLVQFNGSFDPVVCPAAAAAGVPVVVETMHVAEPGGMHPQTDVLVCVSDYVRACQLHPRTLTIHNGIELEKFHFRPRPRGEGPVVLQVANTSKSLAVDLADVAEEVLRRHPGSRIVFAGGRRTPGLPGVTDLGVVREMEPVYQEADLLFMLGVRDAFGLSLAEGMACGCVPIGWNDSGAAGIITPGRDGWLVSRASAAADCLLEAMERACSPAFLRLRREARRTVERRFTLERCTDGYLALYRSLGEASGWRRKPLCAEKPFWLPLARAVVFYGVHDLEQAHTALEEFVRAGRPLEDVFLAHPNGHAAVAAALRACELLRLDGEITLARALCALLRASRCRGELLDAVERSLRANGVVDHVSS